MSLLESYVESSKVVLSALPSYIDTSKTSLWISVFAIAFNPIAWNIIARNGKDAAQLVLFHYTDRPTDRYRRV